MHKMRSVPGDHRAVRSDGVVSDPEAVEQVMGDLSGMFILHLLDNQV